MDNRIVLADHAEFDIEREFYCANCKDFRDVLAGPPGDIVCCECDYVIATFKDREVIRVDKLPDEVAALLAEENER